MADWTRHEVSTFDYAGSNPAERAMSMAHECDLCGAFYKPAPGVVSISDFSVAIDSSGMANTWSEIDFCEACSAKVLAIIGPALNDLGEDPIQ